MTILHDVKLEYDLALRCFPFVAGPFAALVAKELASRGVQLEVIVDEGSSISMDGLAPIYSGPVAMVSTAEKEYVQIEVSCGSQTLVVQLGVPAMASGDVSSIQFCG